MDSSVEKHLDLSQADSLDVAKHAVRVLFEKLAKDIKLINAAKTTVLTDYYVVAYARSSTHCRALANELEQNLSACGVIPKHPEGLESGEWILIDFGGVIIQLFTKEAGEFYRFEKLFAEDAFIPVSDIVTESNS